MWCSLCGASTPDHVQECEYCKQWWSDISGYGQSIALVLPDGSRERIDHEKFYAQPNENEST